MKELKKILEVDLYKPIQSYFIREGYEVYGEVRDCDVVAVKGEDLVVIELKLTLSIDLLVQAAKRLRLTDQVYITIPKPKYRVKSKAWTDRCHLVRRLQLGLILVSISGKDEKTEVIFHPSPFHHLKRTSQSKQKRNTLMKEINGRSADFNVGGSRRTKIMTAYKENCIQIACYLEKLGPLSPKGLIQLGTGDKTSSILTKNYYGWFERVKRGTYIISEKGKQEVNENPDLKNYYLNLLGKLDADRG